MKQLSSAAEVDSAVSGETAILYKHSTTCPISAAAREQMEHFLERHPDAPFFMVDVNDSADVSSYVVEKTGIEHQSPQLIVFRDGDPAWHAAHFDITADALEQQFGTPGS
ncbi:MAG TPA: bacillithiol system redox-active protein YtxJ [Longimicrobiaceae bacterium]|nr:bacillithiol system redox-active protein YtxJ [Longimicrobiaceae bacterium]